MVDISKISFFIVFNLKIFFLKLVNNWELSNRGIWIEGDKVGLNKKFCLVFGLGFYCKNFFLRINWCLMV